MIAVNEMVSQPATYLLANHTACVCVQQAYEGALDRYHQWSQYEAWPVLNPTMRSLRTCRSCRYDPRRVFSEPRSLVPRRGMT